MPDIQDNVVVVGDGPTGLSCALLLAKNGLGVHVLGLDGTPTHKALLRNVLGLPEVTGEAYMREARRQCESFGVRLHRQKAVDVRREGDGWLVGTEEGNRFLGQRLVLANGRDTTLAKQLGCDTGPDGVVVDAQGRTSVEGVHAGGWLTRGARIQLAISIGDGAAIALDILSQEKGKAFHDFDVVPPPGQSPAHGAHTPHATGGTPTARPTQGQERHAQAGTDRLPPLP